MRTITIDRNRTRKRALAEAAEVIRRGGVVAYPTETAYGLAADPSNAAAVRRVYRMKGRSAEKTLPLIAGGPALAGRLVRMPAALARLAAGHWPGPLTVVAVLRPLWQGRIAAAKDGTVAVRVPGLAWPRALSLALGAPITSTSANRSGRPAAYSGADVRAAFAAAPDAPDLLLDAGRLPERTPSTIVAMEHGKITVLRQGKVRITKENRRKGE